MGQDSYEYHGLKAATWDLIRGDTSGWSDRPFYREIIERSGQPALDVGCGTGRLVLDYVSEGMDVDGVDNSPEMLANCRDKAEGMGLQPNLYLQTMEGLDLPRRYRTIFVPSSSFQLLTDPADAAEAMRRFFTHLEPGGTLVMPFMILWTGPVDGDTAIDDWKLSTEKTRPDGAVVRIWGRSVFDMKKKLEHTEDRFEVVKDGVVVESEYHARSPATCWYTQGESIELYKEAGFEDIQLTSDFTFEPVKGDDTIWCIAGRVPT